MHMERVWIFARPRSLRPNPSALGLVAFAGYKIAIVMLRYAARVRARLLSQQLGRLGVINGHEHSQPPPPPTNRSYRA